MPKYEVTVTEVKTITVVVPARNEDEARERGIAIVREPARLELGRDDPGGAEAGVQRDGTLESLERR